MEITPQEKFYTLEEELAYLRKRFTDRKKEHESLNKLAPVSSGNSLEAVRDFGQKAEREVLAEYKRMPVKQVLPESLEIGREELGQVVLKLAPEEHDTKMQELIRLAKEKGIKNALSVLEKLGDFHVTDDFHRFVSEYVREGLALEGVKEQSKDKLTRALHMALYEVVIPEEENEPAVRDKTLKEIISGMEQFYASLLSVSDKENMSNYVSLEIGNSNGESEVVFYVAVPDSKKSLFEKSIISIFHNAKIREKPDDYNIFNQSGVTLGAVAELVKNPIFPLKTYEEFDHDPLNSIINSFSKVDRVGEGAAIQLIWQPVSPADYYTKRYKGALDKIMKGTSVKEAIDMPESVGGDLFKGVKEFFKSSTKDNFDKAGQGGGSKVVDEMIAEEIKKKITSPIVRCNLRLLASAETEVSAQEILEGLESSFNQFQDAAGNSLKWKRQKSGSLKELVRNFSFRIFDDEARLPLSLREITTMIHFHTKALEPLQVLRQSRSATASAPLEMGEGGLLLGLNKHQGNDTEVRLAAEDRLRHFYTIGQTGTGKSTLLKNMIIQDIQNGEGICMIDPHGSDIIDVLANVPKERFGDVIYFDPAYTPRPMALNMLEYDPNFPEQKTFVVNELFSIFKKLYGNVPESMGPAFEQYFRNSALLVMEDPSSGNTLVDISRVLSDKAYRALKLSHCKNPLVSQFWVNAEKTTGEQGLANYVQYVTNKFDVFLANEIMRPVVAQEKSSFNFREIMDNKKILLVNLSKGRLGDINANLIGLILVGKILMAALSRVELFSGSTKSEFPPFYLYMDEFQNITTDSIATILSEARKYKLSLNVAHQYIAQLEENITKAVFGNVGSICSFRVGAEDAEILEKQFGPTFSASDLMNIDNHNAYLKILVGGRPAKPFNIETIRPPQGDMSQVEQLKELSYSYLGRNRAEVEAMILEKYKITK